MTPNFWPPHHTTFAYHRTFPVPALAKLLKSKHMRIDGSIEPTARFSFDILPLLSLQSRTPFGARFFYKYNPRANGFVRNDPHRKFMPNMAWRKRQKVTRVAFRRSMWRSRLSAIGSGGNLIPLLVTAGGWLATSKTGGKQSHVIPPLSMVGSSLFRLLVWRDVAGDTKRMHSL
jgi:hypothetical protein